MVKAKKLNFIGIGLLGGALAFGSFGCESDYQSTQLAAGSAAAQYSAATDPSLSYEDAQGLGVIGGLLGILSQQEVAREAAREGKTGNIKVEIISPETHPHFYNNQNQARQKKLPLVFTCSKSISTYPSMNEIINVRQIFNSDDERVYIIGNFGGIYAEGTQMRNRTKDFEIGIIGDWVDKKYGFPKDGRLVCSKEVKSLLKACDIIGVKGIEFENQWQAKINGKWIDAGSCRFAVFK